MEEEDEEEEEGKDAVWRAYRGVESIEEDSLLREIVMERRVWRERSMVDPDLFSYVATEKTSEEEEEEAIAKTDVESGKKEESEARKFEALDSLEFSDNDFM